MYDLLIRNGLVLDGTGAPSRRADVAVKDGLIVAVGEIEGEARDVIDAKGAIVTPGFIDVHTHYDGQFLWDNELDPSFSNGVTTAIGGNCGVGFAPADPKYRKELVEMMEGVEDIPGIVLDEGLDWNWRSFPDYLDRLGEREYTMDVGAQLAHAPLRVFVMKERALAHEPANDDDIAEMARLTREAMDAGAIGVSGSRILEHLSSKGAHVPGTFAEDREMIALATAMGESGRGVFQIVPLGTSGDLLGTQIPVEERLKEHDRFEALAEASGRPVTYLLHSHNHAPEEWRAMAAASDAARARGLDVHPQVAARGLGLLLGLDSYHIFAGKPSYLEIAHLPRAERAAAMRDPARRAAILSEESIDPATAANPRAVASAGHFAKALHRFYVLRPPIDYEPAEDQRLDRIAEASGKTMAEVFYDLVAEGAGGNMIADFAMNYTNGNLDSVHDMLAHPGTISGLGDGGAHLMMISDAAMPSFHLSFWARDRTRGPKLPIEHMVAKLTSEPAKLYCLSDRGVVAPGKKADLNVIDLDTLEIEMPYVAFDLPKGSGRLLQRAKGYRATIVSGVVTRRNDTPTGAKPGRLIRAH
ncbi:N-acyl-D-amino-acid deacylase family protein [Sphingomonas bacterium]|uniref:N-acyl-D-amino-acid deacylase family protein n=1 Tax=Sphingomonas bacterium TaxID=1895847 RepID=UPI00157590D8|nr:amidohydrolase family protein [Sphingomonas bacterium]